LATEKLVRTKDSSASQADEQVKQYMPLVQQIARRYARFRPDCQEDLIQVGAVGLLKAIQYYDPARARTASFKTVASCYIRGEIRHYLRDHSSLVQVPRRYSELNAQLAPIEESLTKEIGRSPSVQELAARSGFAVRDILEAQQSVDACLRYESFDTPDGEEERDDNRALSEMVADRKYQDFVLASEDRELIAQALRSLGDKTRQIVEFVFFYDLTQKETAKQLGISEMGVSRAVRSALRKLKDVLSTEVL
jgi:RNA polymerase sigma-B factor